MAFALLIVCFILYKKVAVEFEMKVYKFTMAYLIMIN